MSEGIRAEQLRDCLSNRDRVSGRERAKAVVVLGAGNVSAIPLTDTFTKMFQEGSVVLLKMSPVNEYLGPLFEQALQPLIAAGYLRIVFGGPDVGATAVEHELTDEVHLTGSIHSHDQIVWGPPGPEREERIANDRPRLQKPVYSELGSVSPWILIPGSYTTRQLEFQAENVATSVVNNVSFNCVATKVLLTWRQWPQRDEFLDRVEAVFARIPARYSYYPGAVERYRKFARVDPNVELDERLPWTLFRDVKPDENPQFFAEESFVCILVEVALDAPSCESFLRQAVDFANERLWGTLCAALTVPDRFRSDPANEQRLQTAVRDLRYSAIAINHWPALMYAMMSPPWGGFPGSTLKDAQSGIGFVHNTFMLEGIEKSVLEGPLTLTPKPPWFPSHARAEQVAWSYVRLYHRPCWTNATRLLFNALRS
jgi:acyl-CoA reductase-like NAD-dependent aldehyde dehydrogenase